MVDFTIGCDPEIFVKDMPSGKIVSAHGLIQGDKKNPHPVKGGAYQVDGMAVEFNTDPVRLTGNGAAAFSRRVLNVTRQLDDAVKAANPNLTLAIQATADFDKEYLDAQPDEAKELGCDPDYNAYTLEMNPRPNGEVNFRTTAGHGHIGWTTGAPVDHVDHIKICADVAKVLDATIGLASVIYEKDTRRREMYGKAGAFRPKPYGMEYRTPSNFWIANHSHRQAFYKTAHLAISTLTRFNGDSNTAVQYLVGRNPETVRELIDTNNVKEIATLMQRGYYARALSGRWLTDGMEGFSRVLD